MLLAAAATVALAADARTIPSRIQVAVHEGRVTLEVVDAPAGEVVAAIAEHAGFTVRGARALERTITQSFSGEPVARAVRRVLGSTSVVMIHGPGPDAALREVWIYGPGGAAPVAVATARPATVPQPQPVADPRIEELRDQLRQEDEMERRRFAVLRLAQLQGEGVVPALAEGMADSHPEVRMEVARALSTREGELAVMTLGQAVFGDGDDRVRITAVQALGQVGGEAARAILEEVAAKDPAPSVRDSAQATLRQLP